MPLWHWELLRDVGRVQADCARKSTPGDHLWMRFGLLMTPSHHACNSEPGARETPIAVIRGLLGKDAMADAWIEKRPIE